jgi:hypothetical protein
VNDTKQQHQKHRRDEGYLDGRSPALIPQDYSTPSVFSRLDMAVYRHIGSAISTHLHRSKA